MTHEHTPVTGVSWHEYSNLFPMLSGEPLEALKSDIRENGVREPIVFLDGAILDGRNRYMCARDLGLEYPRREFGSDPADGQDPLGFVVSLNLARRHLSESQRAMVAAKLAKLPRGGADYRTANLQTDTPTRQQAADMLNVSERSTNTAKKVETKGAPELVEAVERGDVSVSAAADIAEELPPERQAEAATSGREALKEAAVEAREKKRPPVVSLNTGKTEWYSPVDVVEAARRVLGGFDLDPASSAQANENIKAERFFSADDDGLGQDWPVGRIWMNPPYAANLVGKFAGRFCAEVERGSTGVVLVNNATETAWFQQLLDASSAVCFPKGRLRFICPDKGDDGTPLQGQAIFYAGPEPEQFNAEFAAFGRILTGWRDA